MSLTDKQIDEVLAKLNLPKLVRIKKPEPTKPSEPVRLATDRKLSVEGQRERVMNEAKELAVAERNREPVDPNDFRVKRERDRQAGQYYRDLYEVTARAEYNAKQLRGVDHGNYSPIELFERQMRSEIND